MKITVNDLGSMRYCARGTRAFAERHGFDFRKFIKEGVDAEDVVATGDAMAIELVERVKRERGLVNEPGR